MPKIWAYRLPTPPKPASASPTVGGCHQAHGKGLELHPRQPRPAQPGSPTAPRLAWSWWDVTARDDSSPTSAPKTALSARLGRFPTPTLDRPGRPSKEHQRNLQPFWPRRSNSLAVSPASPIIAARHTHTHPLSLCCLLRPSHRLASPRPREPRPRENRRSPVPSNPSRHSPHHRPRARTPAPAAVASPPSPATRVDPSTTAAMNAQSMKLEFETRVSLLPCLSSPPRGRETGEGPPVHPTGPWLTPYPHP